MEKYFLVSIVIATFNRSELLAETLESVLEQTYNNWECIVVDDGSTDNTNVIANDFVARDNRIKYFLRPSNIPKGPNSSRNFGINKSNGNFIMSLDSDDWLVKNHLEEKINIFKANTNIDAVLSKTIMVDNNQIEIKKETRTMLSDNLLEDFITLKISWYMHDIMWRKSFLDNKMLYNEKLLKWLDRDFHIRRLIENPKIILLDKYLTLYRIHENSNSLNSNYKVLETRHFAVIDILELLKKNYKLTNKMKFFFFKFQVQNLVILHKSPNVFNMYSKLIRKTFIFDFLYFKWFFKLIIGFISFKTTGRGLKLIQ